MSNNKSIKLVDEWGNIRYVNERGEYHREDGPAYQLSNGHNEWWINGLCHREDGPAVETKEGYKGYYLNDKKYSKEEWEEEVIKLKLERLIEL